MKNNLIDLYKKENPEAYAKKAQNGMMLSHPVKIQGSSTRPDNGIHYHSTIKVFDSEKDHPHQIHHMANGLPLNPPDAKNTQIEPGTFETPNGTVYVLKLHGNSAEKLKEHHGKFAHMGDKENYSFEPHISVPKEIHDKIKASGAKTAHEAGISFGKAQLNKGKKVLKTYHHQPDTDESVVPDEGDIHAKMAKSDKLEKGALKNAGIALGMAGALAGASPHTESAMNSSSYIKQHNYDHKKMLNAIAQVESSGGKNTKHAAGGGPIHGSEHAFGAYGIMPETIRETIKGHKDLSKKHGKALALKGQQLHNYMHDNKGLENVIADRHLSHLEHVLGHNPDDLSYAWLNGAQGTLSAKKNKQDIKNHWHVSKVRDAYNKGK